MHFPPLALADDIWWATSATFDSWSEFKQSRVGDRAVRVLFAPEGRGPQPLDAAEQALVQWFFEHEPEVSAAVKQAILEAYPELQATFNYEDEDGAQFMPDKSSIQELRELVQLHSVNVHQVSFGATPYIGFELACSWDEEHGLGVLMHGTRSVEVGGADTAILLWLARQDAEHQSTGGNGEA